MKYSIGDIPITSHILGGNTKFALFGLGYQFQNDSTSLGGAPLPNYRTTPPRTGCVDGPQVPADTWGGARIFIHRLTGGSNSSFDFLELREHRWTLFLVSSLYTEFRVKGMIWSVTEQRVHFCSLNSTLSLFSNKTSTYFLASLFFFERKEGFPGKFRD